MKKLICDRCGKEETILRNNEPDTSSCLKLLKLPEAWMMDLCKDCKTDLNDWFANPKIFAKNEELYPLRDEYNKKAVKVSTRPDPKPSEADKLLEETVALETRINHLSAYTNADTEGLQKQLDEKKAQLDELLRKDDNSSNKKKSDKPHQKIIAFKTTIQRDAFILNNGKYFVPFSSCRRWQIRKELEDKGHKRMVNRIDNTMASGYYIDPCDPLVLKIMIPDHVFDTIKDCLVIKTKSRGIKSECYSFKG